MVKTAIDIAIGIKVNRKRCFRRSEKRAMTSAKANDAAHGGTECSCLPICV